MWNAGSGFASHWAKVPFTPKGTCSLNRGVNVKVPGSGFEPYSKGKREEPALLLCLCVWLTVDLGSSFPVDRGPENCGLWEWAWSPPWFSGHWGHPGVSYISWEECFSLVGRILQL